MLTSTPPKPIPWNRLKVNKYHSPNFKKEVLQQCNSMSTRKVAEIYSINESTIRYWKKKALEPEKSRKEGSGRKPLSVDMEERLFSWITEMRERNLRVTVQSACIQAKVFYKEINPDSSDEFQGSKGWFTRFSNRYNLTIRKKLHKLKDSLVIIYPKFKDFFCMLKIN